MATPEELRALLAAGESDRVEFTNSIARTEKFAEAICAFANDFPGHRRAGVLLIGVCDDGSLAKRVITDRLLQKLASFRSNPPPIEYRDGRWRSRPPP